jgi:hypothetical protein
MPQLDITMNLIWFIFLLLGLGVLYLQNVYLYLPLMLKGWKFRSYYLIYLMRKLIDLYDMVLNFMRLDNYYYSSCVTIKYGIFTLFNNVDEYPYSLDVPNYQKSYD